MEKEETVIGREEEKSILSDILASERPELVAVYGRRRVGKTYLIRNYLKQHIQFEFSGIHHITTGIQLKNFTKALSDQLNNKNPLAVPADWFAAFDLLASLLTPKMRSKKAVIFLDEFPWMQTPKSNFLAAFENFWNNWASRQNRIAIILCGSAASWMIQNVVRNKGGLHNRITRKIPLLPFSLYETEAFLKNRGVNLNRYQITQLYMAMGGIPAYLEKAGPGLSAAQIIDKECFTENGFLYNEFNDLYTALFDKAEKHRRVIRALAAKPMGLNRNEIIRLCELQTGGSTTSLLEELGAAGFITPYIPLGKKLKDSIYKLTDAYSLFYLKFIESAKSAGKGTWTKLSDTPSWKSWSGLAFETICLQHVQAIKRALGITGIYSEASIWRSRPGATNSGAAQIDLLLDRRDHCINVFEIKYYPEKFSIDKKYAAVLQQKLSVFREQTGTNKQL
ncbi:MAG TPA: ATP-binding protein, partial [Pedobacter sp.]